jgi:rhamnosyltransferase
MIRVNPQVSLIIRSFNDILHIEKTMQNICSQTFQNFELINVDSGSTDGTCEVIKKFNKNIFIKIKPQDYIPGKVLNDAIAKSKGEIIVFNNSDCIPQNNNWLENLIKPLNTTNKIATFGCQTPRANAQPLVQKDYIRAFGNGNISSQWPNFFSLATSAIKTEYIKKYPFSNTLQYSEDIDWAYRMRQKGFEIEYIKNAIVEHSHNYTLKELWKRFYNEGHAEKNIYKNKSNILNQFVVPFSAELIRDIIFLIKKGNIHYIPYGILYRLIQKYAVYKGRRN